MTLNVNLLLCHHINACFDQTVEAKIAVFFCKVASYLSYQYINSTTNLKGIPSNFKDTFRFPASKVKLTSRVSFICSQISQLLRFVTQIYFNQRRCDKQKYMDDGTLIFRSAECLPTF